LIDAGLARRLLCPPLGAAADIQAIPADVSAVAVAVSHHLVGRHLDAAEPAGLHHARVCLVALAGGREVQLLAAMTKRGTAGCPIIGGHGRRVIWGTGHSSRTVGGPRCRTPKPVAFQPGPFRLRSHLALLGRLTKMARPPAGGGRGPGPGEEALLTVRAAAIPEALQPLVPPSLFKDNGVRVQDEGLIELAGRGGQPPHHAKIERHAGGQGLESPGLRWSET
jgi:hypothetical protein